jgi:hypothetical protein
MINPANGLARRTPDDHVFHDSLDGPVDFNSHSAARRPGFSVDPANVLVNIGKRGPSGVIGEDFPGEITASLGNN